jgi:hypothetical protein
VPAAAVIPAPIVYAKFAAFKKLVVGFLSVGGHSLLLNTFSRISYQKISLEFVGTYWTSSFIYSSHSRSS